ncbi:hypothetical protein Hanom_Chr11g00981981 [Helianthus anomalus]
MQDFLIFMGFLLLDLTRKVMIKRDWVDINEGVSRVKINCSAQYLKLPEDASART